VDVRIGVGPNGYMDSELSLEWLEAFQKQTKDKNNKQRVLLLDGHASHCGLAFLDQGIELGIIVLSYPPHTTHALQGLDVVIFAVLKHHWQVVRDARERGSGLPVRKEDFLALYTMARTDQSQCDNRGAARPEPGDLPSDGIPSRSCKSREGNSCCTYQPSFNSRYFAPFNASA